MKAAKKRAKSHPLFTIGYEQAKPAAVLDELRRARIELLIDTRAVAASRRPGFSKRQLSASLDDAGIGYVHLQKLGTPAEGRAAARSGDTDALWRIYDKHIKKAGSTGRTGRAGCVDQIGQAASASVLLPRSEDLSSQPHRCECEETHAGQCRRSDPAAVLSYSAGCGARCRPSTLMIMATRASVVAKSNSAMTALTPRTSAKPPLSCRIEIMPIAAPALMNSRK